MGRASLCTRRRTISPSLQEHPPCAPLCRAKRAGGPASLFRNAILRRRANASDLRIPSDMQKSDPARCFIVQNGYCDAAVLDNVMRSAYYIRQFRMYSQYLFGRRRGIRGRSVYGAACRRRALVRLFRLSRRILFRIRRLAVVWKRERVPPGNSGGTLFL